MLRSLAKDKQRITLELHKLSSSFLPYAVFYLLISWGQGWEPGPEFLHNTRIGLNQTLQGHRLELRLVSIKERLWGRAERKQKLII